MTEKKIVINRVSSGIVTIVQVIFIVLKISKIGVFAKWPWWKVMLPIICTTSLGCFIICCSIGIFVCILKSEEKGNSNDKITIDHEIKNNINKINNITNKITIPSSDSTNIVDTNV
tara:strand:- start:210 stop:557 length:348 start_codon:yes stop_codon:yes gene_type:complete